MSIFQRLPTQQWTKLVKSMGRRNGFELKAKCPCRQENCLLQSFSFDIFAISPPQTPI
jgi:hypothetical protein